jgi:hypothetical protein
MTATKKHNPAIFETAKPCCRICLSRGASPGLGSSGLAMASPMEPWAGVAEAGAGLDAAGPLVLLALPVCCRSIWSSGNVAL